MHITQHARQRMTERGISRRLVDFTLRHGRIVGDKHVLDRNESRRLIEQLEEELRLARQAHERGGVTVVGSGDTLITAFNVIAARVRHRGHRSRRGRRSQVHDCEEGPRHL